MNFMSACLPLRDRSLLEGANMYCAVVSPIHFYRSLFLELSHKKPLARTLYDRSSILTVPDGYRDSASPHGTRVPETYLRICGLFSERVSNGWRVI